MIHSVTEYGEEVHIVVDNLMVVDAQSKKDLLSVSSFGKYDEESAGEFLAEVEEDLADKRNMFSDCDCEEPSVDFWVALTTGESIRVIKELEELEKAVEELKEDKLLDLARISLELNAF